jgi:hypothetical protein
MKRRGGMATNDEVLAKQLLVVEYKSLGKGHLHLVINKAHMYKFKVFFITPNACPSFT